MHESELNFQYVCYNRFMISRFFVVLASFPKHISVLFSVFCMLFNKFEISSFEYVFCI